MIFKHSKISLLFIYCICVPISTCLSDQVTSRPRPGDKSPDHLRRKRETTSSSSSSFTDSDRSVKREYESRPNDRFLEVSEFEMPQTGGSVTNNCRSENHQSRPVNAYFLQSVEGSGRKRKMENNRNIRIRTKRRSSLASGTGATATATRSNYDNGEENNSESGSSRFIDSIRSGKAANNYHALFEHYDPKGNPIGLNLENFVETGGCNILPPNWQRRVSGARVCSGCIRLYQGRECTGKRSSDLASWNGCTFFQLYHFNDQAVSVGACN